MTIKLETICIRVTTSCNLQCTHCWSGDHHKKIDIDINELLKFICKLKTIGLKRVSLSGGEPTLYPHIYYLINNLIKNGLDVSITTNGTSSINLSEIVKQIDTQHLLKISVRFSLDGWRDKHELIRGSGTYDSLLMEAKLVSNILGGISFNTVVMDEPFQLERILNDISSLNIIDWALMTPVERGRLKNKQYNKEIIFQDIMAWKNKLIELLPSTKIVVWDYLSHPSGGILIEADGIIKLPGVLEVDDIIIGHMNKVNMELLINYIKKRLEIDPIAYFN